MDQFKNRIPPPELTFIVIDLLTVTSCEKCRIEPIFNIFQMKRYLVIPGKNSTTKCIRTDMKGDMIPQDLLKRAKSEKVTSLLPF